MVLHAQSFLTAHERHLLSLHQREVNKGIEDARQRFGFLFCDYNNMEVGTSVLVEELGKLTRAQNKLHVATNSDSQVREHWIQQAMEKHITVRAVLDRMYLMLRTNEIPKCPGERGY